MTSVSETMASIQGMFDRYFDRNPGVKSAPMTLKPLEKLKAPKAFAQSPALTAEQKLRALDLLASGKPPHITSLELALPLSRVRKLSWDHGFRFSVGARPRRVDNWPKNAYGAGRIPADVVRAMYFRYLELGSLERAAAEFSRTKADLSIIFKNRGLRVKARGGPNRRRSSDHARAA